MRQFVLRDGVEFVAIDQQSGGYPYLVKEPNRAMVWTENNQESLFNYKMMFKEKNWEIGELIVTVIPVRITEEVLPAPVRRKIV